MPIAPLIVDVLRSSAADVVVADDGVSTYNPKFCKYIEVLGQRIAFADTVTGAEGAPVVLFLHGNPTSSYIWRKVIPFVMESARCIAPDLLGMGKSTKPDDVINYTFAEQGKSLDAWIDLVIPEGPVILVLHEWGSALGFSWAHENKARVVGVCYMEAMVTPVSTWQDYPATFREIAKSARSASAQSENGVADQYLEMMLAEGSDCTISQVDMDTYRAPFKDPAESREAILSFVRSIPVVDCGDDSMPASPQAVVDAVIKYSMWLKDTNFAKLLIISEPGAIFAKGSEPLFFSRRFKNQSELILQGKHLIQEDHPKEIGTSIREFVLANQTKVEGTVAKKQGGVGSFMLNVGSACSSQEMENELREDSSNIDLRRKLSQMMMGTITFVVMGALIVALVIFLINDAA